MSTRTVILILLSVAYLVAGAGLARLNTTVFRNSDRLLLRKILNVVFMPASLILLSCLALASIPFFWLYPERHARLFDFEGSPDQKSALAEARSVLRHKKILRRLAERLHLASHTGPEWPPKL